jgi:hypothetical protein
VSDDPRHTAMSYDELLAELVCQYAAEVDADTRELRLWTLARGTQRAEARTRRHLVGIELVVLIDGEISARRPSNQGISPYSNRHRRRCDGHLRQTAGNAMSAHEAHHCAEGYRGMV